MPVSKTYVADPAWLALGEGFSDPVKPADFPEHRLRFRHQQWASAIGLGDLAPDEWEAHFASFAPLPENLPEPAAVRYHGHQFRTYNPDLGDGRGFLFAQVRDGQGRLLDLATKGSGQTPWSRQGDGRLTLKGGVREVLATEMLEALGVYTSKSFSLFETGESLFRGDEPSPTRSAVLVRLGHSHVRFGCFQRLAVLQEKEKFAQLLDYAIEHYAPEAAAESDPPVAFLRIVLERSARLCASWMAAGFIHGVLNTDNMNVTGESFDYGPWRFAPTYDLGFTAAYFDHQGLYAYGRQPDAVFWNLQRLAETLLDVSEEDPIRKVLDGFAETFFRAYREAMLRRLGLRAWGDDRDADVLSLMRAFLKESGVGYENFLFDWWGAEASAARAQQGPSAACYDHATFAPLRRSMETFEPVDTGRLADAYFSGVAPCTMLIDEVEALWDPIAENDDWTLFENKVAEIRSMSAALQLADPIGGAKAE